MAAHLLDLVRAHVLALPPLAKFAIVIAVIAGVPMVARRLRLPEMVGSLLFGVVLGPHVLRFFGEDRPVADFFAELGKLLLMFSAGLEIDVVLFRQVQNRSIILVSAPPSCRCSWAPFTVWHPATCLSRLS